MSAPKALAIEPMPYGLPCVCCGSLLGCYCHEYPHPENPDCPGIDDPIAATYRGERFTRCELCGRELDEGGVVLCRSCGPVCRCERGARGPDGACRHCRRRGGQGTPTPEAFGPPRGA